MFPEPKSWLRYSWAPSEFLPTLRLCCHRLSGAHTMSSLPARRLVFAWRRRVGAHRRKQCSVQCSHASAGCGVGVTSRALPLCIVLAHDVCEVRTLIDYGKCRNRSSYRRLVGTESVGLRPPDSCS